MEEENVVSGGTEVSEVTKAERRRIEARDKNNKLLEEGGITYHPSLPYVEPSDIVTLKSKEKICKRLAACFYSIQAAYDTLTGGAEYSDNINYDLNCIKDFGVEEELNAFEKKFFDGTSTRKDAINETWQSECFYALAWALGFVKSLKSANKPCKGRQCIFIMFKAAGMIDSKTSFKDFGSAEQIEVTNPFENLVANAKLRDVEEILDMLDLYYRYHWAVVDKRINPETKTGKLNGEVIYERRKALEWLISEEDDWEEISLDT